MIKPAADRAIPPWHIVDNAVNNEAFRLAINERRISPLRATQ